MFEATVLKAAILSDDDKKTYAATNMECVSKKQQQLWRKDKCILRFYINKNKSVRK
jgi:hypothetical protein